MMKQICVVSGTRAEYGLLKPLLDRLLKEPTFLIRLVVTGMHLCPEFGITYMEIEKDGFEIDEKIEMVLSSDSHAGMVKSTGLAMISFADYFQRKRPSLLVVLGDRYEMFACASAAAMMCIPIAHLYGGDTTEGAVDEFLRHSITKMSYWHFTSNEISRRRVMQMGEDPQRVFNVGSLGMENILNTKLLSRQELAANLKFDLSRPYAVVTFHPVTLENADTKQQVKTLLDTLDQFPQMKYLFTKANSDANGRVINRLIDEYVLCRHNCVAFTSLGLVRYLSAVRYAEIVIGNSSSGLYEVPAFHIPTINIGNRQKGRMAINSVINCTVECEAIADAIQKGLSAEFREVCKKVVSPYGDGSTSEKIVQTLLPLLHSGLVEIPKSFYIMNGELDG